MLPAVGFAVKRQIMNYLTRLQAKKKARLKTKRDDYAYWIALVNAEEKYYAPGFQAGLQKGLQETFREAY